jgi:hypothetical protein
VWWKTGLDVVPLPDNCFNFMYGLEIRGPGKGNDLVGAVVYLSFLRGRLRRYCSGLRSGPSKVLL